MKYEFTVVTKYTVDETERIKIIRDIETAPVEYYDAIIAKEYPNAIACGWRRA